MIDVLPINLAEDLGIRRKPPLSAADLKTIWKITPYPVITNYLRLCKLVGWEPFGGGTRQVQGDPHKVGYITSGYRDAILNGNKLSAHRYGLALDVCAGGPEDQIRAAEMAVEHGLFNRIGLYPRHGFMHFDLMPTAWIEKYHRTRFWVGSTAQTLFSSNDLRAVISHVRQRTGTR
jgi:hypothetical protein